MRITVNTEIRNNAIKSVLIKPYFFWRLSSRISFQGQNGNYTMRCSKMRLKCCISNRAKTRKPGHSATGWTPVNFTAEMRSTRVVQHGCNGGCSGKRLPNRWPLMTPGLCWPLMTPGLCFWTRSASRNRHNVVFKSRHTVTSKRMVYLNPRRVVTVKNALVKQE